MTKLIFFICILLICASATVVFILVDKSEANIPLSKTNQSSTIEDKSPVSSVIEYVSLSKEGKYKELKEIVISKSVENQNEQNNSNSLFEDSSKIQESSNKVVENNVKLPLTNKDMYLHLTENMPKWINENKLYIQNSSIIENDTEKSHVRVKFGLEKGKLYFTTFEFYLLKTADKNWKIYEVGFK